jgi:hypothetical protein
VPCQRLLLEISRCNRRSKEETGDIDPAQIAAIIEDALAQPSSRRELVLQLAEYLGTAVDGSAMNAESWRPLEHFPHLR